MGFDRAQEQLVRSVVKKVPNSLMEGRNIPNYNKYDACGGLIILR